jgi:integration host factor subunit beta
VETALRFAVSVAFPCIFARREWGEAVALPGKHVPHFKPGKMLRERVDLNAQVKAD